MTNRTSSLVTRTADPVSPDGIRLSQHVEMLIRSVDYVSEADREKLLKVLGAETLQDGVNYEMAEDQLEHISVSEEVQATATLLKFLRKNINRQTDTVDIDTIKAIQSINTALNTVGKMLPLLNSASRVIRLENALIQFGKSLPEEQRGEYMDNMRSALTDNIES